MKAIKKAFLFLPLLILIKLLIINGKISSEYTLSDFMKDLDGIVNQKYL